MERIPLRASKQRPDMEKGLTEPKVPLKRGGILCSIARMGDASEFGDEKAISDEDKRALLMVESPTALKQHLATHASSLTAYDEVRTG